MKHLYCHLFMLCLLLINTLVCASTLDLSNFFGSKQFPKLAIQFEAIYQFGDSLSDTGNYIRERIGVHSTYTRLPYGQAIRPTGRASDGFIMIDFIAKFFHLPLLNPYFATGSDFTHGVNFAVIGATANGGYNSLAKQLRWFRSYLNSTFPNNPIAMREKLQRSLILMGEIGGNDFNGPFYQGKSIEEVSMLIPGVVRTIIAAVEEVIILGAKNIVVPGNFPIGCVPLYLVRFATSDPSKYDNLQCLKDYNNFAIYYNQQLIQALQLLQQRHPDVAIIYGDYYSALISVITYSRHLGIERGGSKKACCGWGNNPYNYGTAGCGMRGSPICRNPSRRVSWDGIHMTQHGNRCVAAFLLKQFIPVLQKHLLARRNW